MGIREHRNTSGKRCAEWIRILDRHKHVVIDGVDRTERALVPVESLIHSFVSASMTPSVGDAVVASGLMKKSRAPSPF